MTSKIWKKLAACCLIAAMFIVTGGRTPILAVADEAAPAQSPVQAVYSIYTNDHLWGPLVPDNMSCRAADGMFMTSVLATLTGQPEGMTGTITYQVNLSGSGWLDWMENGAPAGTTESDTPLEAVRMELTGQLLEAYDLYYAVLQNGTWTPWAVNGETAGVEGQGMTLQGIRVTIAVKGTPAPAMAPEDPVVLVPEPEPEPQPQTGPVDPSRPMVALTFDDGPNAPVTNRILDGLEQYGGRATFFMVGNRVRGKANTDVVRRMTALGCEVGNHTFEHREIVKLTPAEIQSQLTLTNQAVAAACGVSPIVMRPPGGARDEASLQTVEAVGMAAVLWSLDTRDWRTKDKDQTVSAVLDHVRDGDIILMHDLYDATADAAVDIIPELIRRGYQLVTVSEMAAARGGMEAGKAYGQFRPR